MPNSEVAAATEATAPSSADEEVAVLPASRLRRVRRLLGVLGLFYLFLLGVNGFGAGFTLIGKGALEVFFSATENPFFGLVMGILATSVVQSSSVTTSLIVGLVAAPENALPLQNALPMVLGANFGTTVTNTIVALAHLRHKAEFSRAFAVSTVDDFYKLFIVSAFLPLELATGFLSKGALAFTETLRHVEGSDFESPLAALFKLGIAPLTRTLLGAGFSEPKVGVSLLVLSGGLIVVALMVLVRTLRTVLSGEVRRVVTGALDRSPLLSMLGGMFITMIVQSSSVTTSMLVPLAGAGVLDVRRALPIVLGASLGTTSTALLASMAATGPHAEAGLTIALVHVLFNVAGVLLVYPFPRVQRIPIRAAEWLAGVAGRSPSMAIIYVVALFYGVPAALAALRGVFAG